MKIIIITVPRPEKNSVKNHNVQYTKLDDFRVTIG